MASLDDLKRKIDLSQDLQSVVRTMKALAAVSIRQYEKAIEALEDYNRTVELGLQTLLRSNFHQLRRRSVAGSLGVIIFGSDQGMCGQFNEQIANHLQDYLTENGISPGELRIGVVGQRLAPLLQSRRLPVAVSWAIAGSVQGITPLVQVLFMQIEQWRESERLMRVLVVHHQHRGGAGYHPQVQQLLPFDPQWLGDLREKPWPGRSLPQIHQSPDQLFSTLVQQYCFVSLFQACAASLASESASRLSAMQVAEKNINERLDTLQREYQQERQTAITNELLDIVAGFEALTHETSKSPKS